MRINTLFSSYYPPSSWELRLEKYLRCPTLSSNNIDLANNSQTIILSLVNTLTITDQSQLISLIAGELHAAMQANSAPPDWLGGKFSLNLFCYFLLEIFLKIMSV